MRIATTPTHKFYFPAIVSVGDISEAEFTYGQRGEKLLTKTLDDFAKDLTENSLSIKLKQEETKKFAPGEALVQARIKVVNGAVLASQMLIFDVKPVLDSEEI